MYVGVKSSLLLKAFECELSAPSAALLNVWWRPSLKDHWGQQVTHAIIPAESAVVITRRCQPCLSEWTLGVIQTP